MKKTNTVKYLWILLALIAVRFLFVGWVTVSQQRQTIEQLQLENGLLATFNEQYEEELKSFMKKGAYKQGCWDMWEAMTDRLEPCLDSLPHCSERGQKEAFDCLKNIGKP